MSTQATTDRRDRERADVRQKILDAAREAFVRDGYDAVSMRQIADRIEYSATAIYHHFADKEALFRELCARDFLALGQRFAAIARVADPIERVRQLGHAYVDFGLEHPQHYRLMFMTPSPVVRDEISGPQKGDPDEDAYALLRLTVAEGIAQGRFRPELTNADQLAQTLWAGTHGIVSLHIAKSCDDWVHWQPTRETACVLIDATLRGLTREDLAP
jgi:AcrR family transcriptional regulator